MTVNTIFNDVVKRDRDEKLAGEWKIGDPTKSALMKRVIKWVELWLMVRERQEAMLKETAAT